MRSPILCIVVLSALLHAGQSRAAGAPTAGETLARLQAEEAAHRAPLSATQVAVVMTAEGTKDRLTPQPSQTLTPGLAPRAGDVVVEVHSEQHFQTMLGFGGAFTDSAAHVLSKLNKTNYDQVMDLYFGPHGQQYTFGRVPMGACDYSTTPEWSYAQVKDDYELANFSLAHDLHLRIPIMQDALKRRAQTNATIKMLGSPWSAPGWMKKDGAMICNIKDAFVGNALRDEPQVYRAFSNYFVRFVKGYAEHGINVSFLTVTNEPQCNFETCLWGQEDEGMSFTPETERDFVKKLAGYLGPYLRANCSDVKLLYLDHNKDKLVNWSSTILGDKEAAQYLWGGAVHWYTGDHFDALNETHHMFPDHGILATEATEAHDSKMAPQGGTWKKGEHYGHDMIGDFNNYVMGFIDWNLILDSHGGPLHIGPLVVDVDGADAMMIADLDKQEVYLQAIFYYMGHFSRYVPENSVRIGWEVTAGNATAIQTTSFLTPANTVVSVLMNQNDAALNYTYVANGAALHGSLPPHSIQTLLYSAAPSHGQ